jgi:hypothetical protein
LRKRLAEASLMEFFFIIVVVDDEHFFFFFADQTINST